MTLSRVGNVESLRPRSFIEIETPLRKRQEPMAFKQQMQGEMRMAAKRAGHRKLDYWWWFDIQIKLYFPFQEFYHQPTLERYKDEFGVARCCSLQLLLMKQKGGERWTKRLEIQCTVRWIMECIKMHRHAQNKRQA